MDAVVSSVYSSDVQLQADAAVCTWMTGAAEILGLSVSVPSIEMLSLMISLLFFAPVRHGLVGGSTVLHALQHRYILDPDTPIELNAALVMLGVMNFTTKKQELVLTRGFADVCTSSTETRRVLAVFYEGLHTLALTLQHPLTQPDLIPPSISL
jgi:hypothetical protein